MEVFLSTPYIHNNKKYSNWNAYNFQTHKPSDEILTKDNIHLFEGNAAYMSQSGYMEFRAQKEEAFSVSLQYGQLSSLYDDNKVLSTLPLTPGALKIGHDAEKALLFWDSGDKRLPFSAVVKWSEILNKPTNLAYSTDISNLSTSISNDYLAKKGGTMTGEITIGQGDGKGIQLGTGGRINATITTNGVTSTTCTLLGIIKSDEATVGHGNFKIRFRGSEDRPVYNSKSLALYSDIPTDFTTTTAATTAENNAKKYADDLLANLKLSDSTAYFTSLTNNNDNSFTLNKSAANSQGSTWTANNYYPEPTATWNEDRETGIYATFKMLNNGSAISPTQTITIPKIPAATQVTYGIVSNTEQTFGGVKNFADPIKIQNQVSVEYNTLTESLDFTFV